MKIIKLIAVTGFVLAIGTCSAVFADGSHNVKGHTNKDGTYVAPHKQTNPDKSRANNWSTKGNTNPYTGKKGTVDPNKEPVKKK